MYRIGEAAGMLNIDKTVIFEKMINNSKELSPHIVKKNSITFITQDGIEVLDALINDRKLPEKEEIISEEDRSDLLVFEEDEDEYISEEDLEDIRAEKNRIKEEILKLRNKMLSLDTEIKRLDEAIVNYEEVIKEDLEWIRINENKLKYKISLFSESFTDRRWLICLRLLRLQIHLE